jgi:hypothetical protein
MNQWGNNTPFNSDMPKTHVRDNRPKENNFVSNAPTTIVIEYMCEIELQIEMELKVLKSLVAIDRW